MGHVNWVLRVIGMTIAPGLFLTMNAQTINIDWAKSSGGTNTEVGKAVTADVLGNSYCVGYFNGMMDADPGPAFMPLVSAGMQDVFIVKTSASGQTLWAKRIGGSQPDIATAATLDQYGNLYITGSFRGTVDFDPGSGIYNLASFSTGSQDIFTAKYDPNGNLLWAQRFGGEGYTDSLGNTYAAVSSGYAIRYDQHDHILLTGRILGCIDFDSGPGVDTLSARISPACFIVQLNLDGQLRWARQLGGGLHGVEGYGIGYAANGDVYTSGVFGDSADFDPGPNTWWMRSMAYSQAFVSKLDSNGQFIWARQAGGQTLNDQATAQSIDVDGIGNVVTGGQFKGNGDFDPGPAAALMQSNGQLDIFLLKLDASGQFVWVRQTGGPQNEYCYSVSIGMNGLIFATGNFRGSVDFDPGYLTQVLSSASTYASDLYVTCYTTSGDLMQAVGIGSNGGDGGNAVYANQTGHVNVCGYLSGPAMVGLTGGLQSTGWFGGIDIFQMKFKDATLPVLSVANEARMMWNTGNSVNEPVNVDASFGDPKAGWTHEGEMHQRPLVYPVPCKRMFTIEFPKPVKSGWLRVFNMAGELLYATDAVVGKVCLVDPGYLKSGNYLLEVSYSVRCEPEPHVNYIRFSVE